MAVKKRKVAKARSKKKRESSERKVVYPKLISKIRAGKDCITVDNAKELLGWNADDAISNVDCCKELKKRLGIKVELTNNTINRRLYSTQLNTLTQEILRKRWRFNGEPIIVGCTGQILNGQHALISLVLAAHEHSEGAEHSEWDEEPFIEKLIVYGVEEDDELINTMDTCKPRSVADVIDRAGYFKDLPASGRHKAARFTDHAIKMIWLRTATNTGLVNLRRTHAEVVAYLESHISIVKAVAHIYEEEGTKKNISRFTTPGYAAALLYLMAASKTELTEYYNSAEPTEDSLDFSMWDTACNFWVELAAGEDSLKAVGQYMGKLLEDDGYCGVEEQLAILSKAWNLYKNDEPITIKSLHLKFESSEGVKRLAEQPLVGGIDVGDEGLPFEPVSGVEATVKLRKQQVDKQRSKEPTAKRKGKEWAEGDTAWVHQGGGLDPFFAEIVSKPYKTVSGMDVELLDLEGNACIESVDKLSLKRYELTA